MDTNETWKDRIKNRWKLFLCVLFLVLGILVWTVISWEDRAGMLTVSFLDVGQGDAIFIDTPSGVQLLIDGGPPGKLIPRLSEVMPFYDRSIDLLLLSHPHLDHFGGLLDVLGRYKVGGIITSGTQNESSDYDSFKEAEKDSGLHETIVRHGTVLDLGGGVALEVVMPEGDVRNASPHIGMLVTRLSYGSTTILFTGDMEENLEAYLVKRDGASLESDVLKAGHHGSKTSSSEAFLKLVKPTAVVVSSGEGNKYNHPSTETMDLFVRSGIDIYRTDETGTITLKTDGRKIEILP